MAIKKARKNIAIIWGMLVLTIFMSPPHSQALDQQELKALQEAVKEMCVTPTKQGDYLKVEGEAEAGLPVILKFIHGNIKGQVSYEKWEGLNAALDNYKTDPRKCAIETLKILVPVFNNPEDSASTSGDLSPVLKNVQVGGDLNIGR